MIFRGDGKNNLIEGSCFTAHLTATNVNGFASASYVRETNRGFEPATRILMNPPFKNQNNGLKSISLSRGH